MTWVSSSSRASSGGSASCSTGVRLPVRSAPGSMLEHRGQLGLRRRAAPRSAPARRAARAGPSRPRSRASRARGRRRAARGRRWARCPMPRDGLVRSRSVGSGTWLSVTTGTSAGRRQGRRRTSRASASALVNVSARTSRMSSSSTGAPTASSQLSGGTRNRVGAGVVRGDDLLLDAADRPDRAVGGDRAGAGHGARPGAGRPGSACRRPRVRRPGPRSARRSSRRS